MPAAVIVDISLRRIDKNVTRGAADRIGLKWTIARWIPKYNTPIVLLFDLGLLLLTS